MKRREWLAGVATLSSIAAVSGLAGCATQHGRGATGKAAERGDRRQGGGSSQPFTALHGAFTLSSGKPCCRRSAIQRASGSLSIAFQGGMGVPGRPW